MYCDYHFHTCFSSDSTAPVEDQIRRAIALGMTQICITDHQDLDFPPGELTFQFDTEEYFRILRPLQEKYRDQICLKIGVELGIQPSLGEKLAAYYKEYPFDYCIGSTHLVRRMDPYEAEYWKGRPVTEALREYFEEVFTNIQTFPDADSLGHLDYAVRYAPNREGYDWKNYQDVIDETLKFLIRKDICLECNTAGFKAGLGHPNPTEGILKRYKELGGEAITLGSDGHEPAYLGQHFDQIGELLKGCGFHEYVIFEKHRPRVLPL